MPERGGERERETDRFVFEGSTMAEKPFSSGKKWED